MNSHPHPNACPQPSSPAPGAAAHPWLLPQWPAPAGVRALFTTRSGGVSAAPFDSLNLGSHVGDVPADVDTNRARLQLALRAQSEGAASAGRIGAVFLNQVHGTHCVLLQPADVAAAVLPGATPPQADACLSTDAGVVCTSMVADCLPVLFAHRSGRVVGAAHAGWRGLAGAGTNLTATSTQAPQGVLEAFFEHFCLNVGGNASSRAINFDGVARAQMAADTLVWLGPCIGPTAFEVGAEVRAAFGAEAATPAGQAAARCFVAVDGAAGKYWCDLAGLARLRLQALGITAIYGNDSSPDWCTFSDASRFFSHRRDAARLGSTGRMVACIWRD